MAQSFSALLFSFLAFLGLGGAQPPTAQGYVEAEYVLVAPQIPGRLETLNVSRGQPVQKDMPLFALECQAETLAVLRAEAETTQKAAQLDDLLKGKRQPELDALIALRSQAASAFDLARINFERDDKLLKTKAVSQAELDARRATLDQARAKLEEAEAALAMGQQSLGRDDAILAAQAALDAAKASRAEAQWRLDQKSVGAPEEAFVFDTLFRPGEYVAAGQPIVSLLPPENIKIRFFVAEPQLAGLRFQQRVEIRLSGGESLGAKISYFSPKAEYTPPQLFNRDNREKLLYMVEAVPEKDATRLHPGQPVDVFWEAQAPQ